MANTRVGIIGGYGRVGQEAAKCLLYTTDYNIIIGGRNNKIAEATAESMGPRFSSQVVDVYNQHSLDSFCRRCDIVINCAGPSRRILDKVALSALREGVHYVDAAGDDPLYDSLASKNEAIKKKKLTFVISAGMYPGLSGVFPAYVAANRFDSVDSLEIYFAGGDTFTFSAAYDYVCSIQEDYGKGMAYYQNGQIKKKGIAPTNAVLPSPIGKVDAYPLFTQELRHVVESCNIKSARAYIAPVSKSIFSTLFYIQSCKQYKTEAEKNRSANLLMKASEEDLKNKKPCSMFHLIMQGKKSGLHRKLISTLFFEEDGSKLTAIVAANTARLILDGFTNGPGRFVLQEGININEFMGLLEQQNISPVQSFDDQNSESGVIY